MHKIQVADLEGRVHCTGYKVLTKELKSLGLRKNPNIIQYPLGEWYFLPEENIKDGLNDWGGIWVNRTLGDAKKLAKYVLGKHNIDARIFRAAIDKVLYANSYRIKTNGICLIEELIYS